MKISFNCSDEMFERLKKQSDKLEGGMSELIRLACEQYLSMDAKQGNMHTILGKFDEAKYENAKTRALLLEIADRLGVAITEIEMDEVEEDARAYVEKPLAPSVGG